MEDEQYRERLARDVAAWQHEDLISRQQAQAILARQGAGSTPFLRAVRMGWLVTAASLIGAVTLAAGVVLLFAANWEEMPDTFRVAVLFGGLVATYGAAYVLMYRMDLQRVGSAMLLLGVLLYQAALFLLAQIYNMPVDSPILFLFGAIGGLPLAYFFGSRIILLLSIAAVTIWQTTSAAMRYDGSEAEAWAILLFAAVFGVLLYAVGRMHFLRDSLRRFGEVYLLAGALLALGIVYFASFGELWDELINSGVESYAAPTGIYWLIGVTAAAIGVQAFVRHRTADDLMELGAQSGLLALAAVVATWPAWSGYALVFNAVFFAAGAAIIARGYVASDERYVNFGLAAVALGLFTRYVDTFWSLLGGSAFFIVGGALLLGLAFGVERFRRELLRSMRDDDDGPPAAQQAEVSA